VSNLVLNAAQAMPAGGTICVSAAFEPAPGDVRRRAVAICVEDTGVGIDPALRERVFEPFFTTRARGTGLGLVVVRRIVEAHNGRISVDSEPGRGTNFKIVLPLDHDDAGALRGSSAPPPVSGS
jgi:signal transduction histidine kinase